MNDLISRQDAIDAVHKNYDTILDFKSDGRTMAYSFEDIINALPSVQPEIVRCHKCIHWDRDTVRQNSNDARWWNEAICERYSDGIWASWKDADWYCADAERRTDGSD